ncbi:DUF222 domain-containing protein [Paenarthrobacter nitroguajacolicus]|uniref:HNH endonuclease signature motif containing protein n=1 Tax=Paenarthrobacter nitroguajacolicus TaxID=211146 RepID=UPI00285914E2|nr:DUF222 domain-containing protein [Paenarthrobacter nitroguajacolicus]MDR6638431.1 hypothetical protein [Paenarthrobacter nitroguajacolicus]
MSVPSGGSSGHQDVGAHGSASAFEPRVDPSGEVGPSGELAAPLAQAVQALTGLRDIAVSKARVLGFVEAADFAGRIEDISRTLEYLQVVAAHAVERTRHEAQQARDTGAAGSADHAGAGGGSFASPASTASTTQASFLDDGYRNAAEFLRARLRIGIGEARRRLALAADTLPHIGLTGQHLPARRQVLADALATAQIPSRSVTIISTALDNVRHLTNQDTLARMEHALTRTAIQTDPDFLTKITKRWNDYIDQDGPEPTEEALRQSQGAFLRRRRRHGLHHLEIFATDEQIETLTTAMNTATNPRLTPTHTNTGTGTGIGTPGDNGSRHSPHENEKHGNEKQDHPRQPAPNLDRRSRAQKLLDGLVGACNVAMTTGKLPTNGGLRPQLTVTISHQDLFDQLTHTPTNPDTKTTAGTGTSTGAATFTGPIHPNTIRKIACDADIIPVLLGTDSRVLDIGRTTRIFPPHIRKAITARDGGCAFPDCTMPAPWCETHHITYWSHGGTTGTENGTLLCSHHHHLIHKEQWTITNTNGTPWFIPPPHIDPTQTPRRNHHHTPLKT